MGENLQTSASVAAQEAMRGRLSRRLPVDSYSGRLDQCHPEEPIQAVYMENPGVFSGDGHIDHLGKHRHRLYITNCRCRQVILQAFQ